MKQLVCSICSYTYDEAKGIPEAGIAPGTKWKDLPEDWKCPLCRADKSQFREKTEQTKPTATPDKPHVEKELSAMEMSIICSNLARGCEKQYLLEEAEQFRKIAEVLTKKVPPQDDADVKALSDLLKKDIELYPGVRKTADQNNDRGAARICVWGEKVTRMLDSLVDRYLSEGEAMLENTQIWVCTTCGFVFVGEAAPELCPVCKVPSWKFEKVEGR